ncbi:MAG: integrase family protein [Proteobacteria bacterium]|nr:integrase family protein [Pseudomonadota bacterium]
MARLRLTDTSVRDLPAASGVNRVDYDIPAPGDRDFVKGFAVRTSSIGTKHFLLIYVAKETGQERRMVLGEFGPAPRLTVSAARRLGAEKRALVDLGRDPWLEAKQARAAAEKKAEKEVASLGNLLAAYVEHLKALGKASWREVERAIDRHITPKKKLAATPADQVAVDTVMPVFHGLTKEGKLREAEKLRAYLRAAYTAARKARTDATMHAFAGFAIRENPLQDLDVSRPREAAEKAAEAAKVRKWALSEDQLRAYWRRISVDTPAGALLRFHLLTGGQRIEQLARLTVDDYDADTKTVTLRDTKGRRQHAHEHVVPLPPDAVKALEAMRQPRQDEAGKTIPPGPHLFTLTDGDAPVAYHVVWEAIQEVAKAMVEAKEVPRPFTPGTIRKTVETRLAAKGTPDEVLARLLSHGLGGVQARNYNAHRYDDEKRSALKKLRALLDPPKGKVVEFPKQAKQ